MRSPHTDRYAWPHATAAAILIAFLAHALCLVDVDDHDLLLAIPLIKEYANPGLYSSHDLIITAGRESPFFVYKFLGLLARTGIPITSYCGFLYSLLLAATLVPLWLLVNQISNSRGIASTVCLLLASADSSFGALHWTFFPTRCLISASFAMPFFFLSLYLAFRGLYKWLPVHLIATAALHPGFGLIALCLSSAWAVVDSDTAPRTRLRSVVSAWIGFIVLLIASTNLSSGTSEAASQVLYWTGFKALSWHTYVEKHWPHQYLQCWAILCLCATLLQGAPRRLRWFSSAYFAAAFTLISLYLINLYLVHSISFALTFLFRASLVLKVLGTIIVIVYTIGFLERLASTPQVARIRYYAVLIGIVLFITASMQALESAQELFICLSALFIFTGLVERRWAWGTLSGGILLVLLICSIPSLSAGTRVVSLQLLLGVATALCIRERQALSLSPLAPDRRMSAGLATLVLVLGFVQYNPSAIQRFEVHSSRSADDAVSLAAWARDKTAPGSLFVTDFYDDGLKLFRAVAERGIFIRAEDIAQLSYKPERYIGGLKRMESLGADLTSVESLQASAMKLSLTAKNLEVIRREVPVDFVVLTTNSVPLDFPIAYRNATYTVYQLPMRD